MRVSPDVDTVVASVTVSGAPYDRWSGSVDGLNNDGTAFTWTCRCIPHLSPDLAQRCADQQVSKMVRAADRRHPERRNKYLAAKAARVGAQA